LSLKIQKTTKLHSSQQQKINIPPFISSIFSKKKKEEIKVSPFKKK